MGSVEAEDENEELLIQPHSQLPQAEAPAGVLSPVQARMNRSRSLTERVVPAIGKYLRDRSNSFSAAIARKLYSNSFKESSDKEDDVTEITLRGVKVIVKLKSEQDEDMRRRMITFFSRSNCRDCRAARWLLRDKGVKFVEINMDVYPEREKELVARTGSPQVPQIFLNDKLFGGLLALNSLRNTTTDDDFHGRMMEEMMLKSSSQDQEEGPPHFDDIEDQVMMWADDEMLEIVRVVRNKVSIQDRLVKLKIVKNCFVGSEMVDLLIPHFHYDRNKAIEIGKELGRKHFIHHVFGENEFEYGNNKLYRFLEHEPFIYRCYNFRGCTNEHEPKPVSEIGMRMTKIMVAILEAYASDDRMHIDYVAIRKSEEFQRYLMLSEQLHRVVDLKVVTEEERVAFFLNLYNAMVIHAVIRVGLPISIINDPMSHFSDFQYLVGGYPYTLSHIQNGILRNNRRPPYSLVKPFAKTDKRLELAVDKVNPLINLGLYRGTRSSPRVRFFTAQGVEAELRCAAREFFQSGGVEVDLHTRTVTLTRLIKWFRADFGVDKHEMLMWIMDYLDPPKAGLLTHLLGDSGPISIVYQNYDWSINS